MNLQVIKNEVEKRAYPGGIKALAEDAGLTEQKLHRCVRDNKIPAQDLERIAKLLKVSITIFFDEENCTKRTEGDFSPIDSSVIVGDAILAERVKALEKLVEEKERTIQILMGK